MSDLDLSSVALVQGEGAHDGEEESHAALDGEG